MTHSESLSVISEMIHMAKGELRGNHFYFLFWGWLIMSIHITHYCLIVWTNVAHSELIWTASIAGGIISFLYGRRKQHRAGVVSHFNRSIGLMWAAYGFTLTIIITASVYYGYSTYALVTVLTAFPTFLTGVIVKYKPLIYCGSLFWIFGVVSFSVSPLNQIIVGAIAIGVGYLVPGYMMKTDKSSEK